MGALRVGTTLTLRLHAGNKHLGSASRRGRSDNQEQAFHLYLQGMAQPPHNRRAKASGGVRLKLEYHKGMDNKIIADALLLSLRYVSNEGSAGEKVKVLEAIREIGNSPWVESSLIEAIKSAEAEQAYWDKHA